MSAHPHPVALSDAEIEQRLKDELPNWYYENGWIRRKIKTSGWKATLMVVTTVGHLAEKAWHHPDMSLSYAFVIVKLVTHSAKGVTERDFALAKKIEEVVVKTKEKKILNQLEETHRGNFYKDINSTEMKNFDEIGEQNFNKAKK